MNVMTKRGSLDNIVTYEHFCDSKADLDNIPKSQITLGSTAIVLQDENDSMGVYLATSQKEWVEISTSMNGGGSTAVELLHICSSGEYDSETKVPTVEEPDENMLYLVPNNGEGNNLFDEWIYVDGEWEKFSGTEISIPTPDWNVDSSDVAGYIDNKPAIKSGTGTGSIIEGHALTASGTDSHAEGAGTIAAASYSHAEGKGSDQGAEITVSSNNVSYTYVPGAYGDYSHVEGHQTRATSICAHAEGWRTQAGRGENVAIGGSHAEGELTIASGDASHAEGSQTLASGYISHAEGNYTTASGRASHTEGYQSTASGQVSHAEGQITNATGSFSHSEGAWTKAGGMYSHAEGAGANNVDASMQVQGVTYTYSPGAYGDASHTEGYRTIVYSGIFSGHAEGYMTMVGSASGGGAAGAHAEGNQTIASGGAAHAEGNQTVASGYTAHAEGVNTTASDTGAHAEGLRTQSLGTGSHAEGLYTIAKNKSQHVFGEYNLSDPSTDLAYNRGNYVEIVGNGDSNTRSNARTLDWNGNQWVAGNIAANGGSLTLGSTTITEVQLQTLLSLSSATGVGF